MTRGHVVATAGHVDHGKSALVRALTGIEPDRWEEERRRGLTIDLGYAWTELPSGREVGFVDVPGHERFVRNMLAGVGPVRTVLFVVAADEGWRAQSEEHLQILDVLGVDGAVVALTKADLADDDALAARREDLVRRLDGTALKDAPVVACSATSGAGLDDLRRALDAMVAAAPVRTVATRVRLHVDRAFTIHGSGTVLTGTLVGGTLRVDDRVELLPGGAGGRVRALERHERRIAEAVPVSRVAANIAGIAASDASRGDALVHPGEWRPTAVFDGTLRGVRGLPAEITSRGAFKVHAGAAERDARIRLLDADGVRAGEACFVRIRLGAPLALEPGDRYVLRDSGRRVTVGGGEVLDPAPPARPGADAAARLARRRDHVASPAGALVADRGLVLAADVLPLSGERAERIDGARRIGAWWISESVLGELTDAATAAVRGHHERRPLSPGPRLDELGAVLGRRDVPWDDVLRWLEEQGVLERSGAAVRLRGHRVDLGPREGDALRVEAALRERWPAPPMAEELGADRELLDALAEAGRIVAVSRELYVLPEHAQEAAAAASELASRPDGMTASDFRTRLGTSRKYAIPVLEWLDRTGITRRDGDVRRLRAR